MKISKFAMQGGDISMNDDRPVQQRCRLSRP